MKQILTCLFLKVLVFTSFAEALTTSKEESFDIEKIKSALSKTPIGRKVLANTQNIPILKVSTLQTYSARYVNGRIEVTEKILSLGDQGKESTLLHELAHAQANMPFELIEDEQRSYQYEIQYALEKAAYDKDFSEKLRKTFQQMQKFEEQRRHIAELETKENPMSSEWEKYSTERQKYFSENRDLAGVAKNMLMFSESPGDLYWDIQLTYRSGPHHISFSDLHSFIQTFGAKKILKLEKQIDKYKFGPYYVIDGNRYFWILVKDAITVVKNNGIQKLRDRLGPYDTSESDALLSLIEKFKTAHTK